jgi:PAS domain S-box-containing protein
MRKRVILGITALCMLFLAGGVISIFQLRRITTELAELIEPHEAEMMRQELLFAGSELQNDLLVIEEDEPVEVDKLGSHASELHDAIRVCLSCHHRPSIREKQEHIEKLIIDYEEKIHRLASSQSEARNEIKNAMLATTRSINEEAFAISKLAGLHMEQKETRIIAQAHRSWIIFIIILGIGFPVAFYVAYSFSQSLIAPMEALVTATKRIASGDLSYRARIDSKDEFAELADSFNIMTENLQRSYETISRSNVQIRETRDYLAALISSMDDSIIVIDKDFRIMDVNPSFYRLMGLPEKSIRGKKIDEIFFEIGDRKVYPLAEHPIEEVFERGESKRAIKAQVIPNGEVRSFEITASPIKTNGEVDKVLEVVRDITERVEMEKAILLRDKELKETQEKMVSSERLRALGEMAAGIAHGFNNILSGILGNIQNLLETAEDPEMRNTLKLIENTTMDGAEIVRRIQEFSRVRKAGTYTEVDINEIIQDTMKITEAKWKNEAASWGIRFDFEMDLGDTPPLFGNPAELREALTNIFLNAFEAMPQGGKIFVSTRTVDSTIEVIIQDTGKGMDEQTVKKVFDPFFTTKGVKGTGLGLSITYGIITRHDGEIKVSSELQKGTRFVITLPVKEIESVREESFHPGPRYSGSVLVIDDEPMILNALDTMLKRAGHEVTCCYEGQSGLKAAMEKDYDIVITDLGMQDVSGWEITKALRNKNSSSKIIMLTGWGFQLDAERTKEAGVDILISKPFTKKQILDAINRLLASARKERPEE